MRNASEVLLNLQVAFELSLHRQPREWRQSKLRALQRICWLPIVMRVCLFCFACVLCSRVE